MKETFASTGSSTLGKLAALLLQLRLQNIGMRYLAGCFTLLRNLQEVLGFKFRLDGVLRLLSVTCCAVKQIDQRGYVGRVVAG